MLQGPWVTALTRSVSAHQHFGVKREVQGENSTHHLTKLGGWEWGRDEGHGLGAGPEGRSWKGAGLELDLREGARRALPTETLITYLQTKRVANNRVLQFHSAGGHHVAATAFCMRPGTDNGS